MQLQNESGLSNSSLQQGNGQADKDVDIGVNDPLVPSHPPVEIEKDTCHRNSKFVSPGSTRASDVGCSSDSEPNGAKVASPVEAMKDREKKRVWISYENGWEDRKRKIMIFAIAAKPYEEKIWCKNTMKEKTRLQAETEASEDAQRRAVAEAAAEARQKRELEREVAWQKLLKLPSSVDETSLANSQDGLGSFKFGGRNPLEQLGFFHKDDEREEDGHDEPP
ncbi:hypothetical protein V6N12_033850 [Hibiscus sabdariffa]|uniref:Uncharacterized protein n=1 Tax=Hibiscus sabdariffa TaxID=183260 RepID=A0ABR1ZGB4_9ROSI